MKNNLIITIVLLAFSVSSYGQAKLEITVKNIKEAKGSIRVGLYNSEDDFLKREIDGKITRASGTQVTVIFEISTPGDYAVSVIHDENDNGEMDSNFMGIPKEGFAFGNNAMGTFGPPSFQKAKVKVTKETVQQELLLKYM